MDPTTPVEECGCPEDSDRTVLRQTLLLACAENQSPLPGGQTFSDVGDLEVGVKAEVQTTHLCHKELDGGCRGWDFSQRGVWWK